MEIIEPRQDSTFGPEVKAVLAEAGEVLQKCKRLARSSKVWRPSRLFGVQDYDLTPPPREVADIMAREYFQYFESGLRVLHIPSFWSSYEQFWENPNSVKIETRIIILLVIAIGSSFQDRKAASTDKAPSIPQIHQWIYAAQTWLAGPLEKDRLDIGGLQAYCLLIMARQIYSVGATWSGCRSARCSIAPCSWECIMTQSISTKCPFSRRNYAGGCGTPF